MHLHSNATTTPATRRWIQAASGSVSEISRRFGVSRTTVRRWRARADAWDRSSRPQRFRTAFSQEEEEALLELRRRGLALDEVFEASMDAMPRLCRTSVWRLFRRNGLARLRRAERKAPGRFEQYPPGYVHIDSFYTPRFGSARHYGFVAVDRATRRTHVAVYRTKGKASGADFLRRCAQAFEFRIHTVLTDNGTEFTNKAYNRNGRAKAVHEFDRVCREHGIRHRLTKPRTPKTNGLAERQVAIVKNATTKARTYASPEDMVLDICSWNEKSNGRRQRRIGFKTPLQVSQEWYEQEPGLFKRPPMQAAA
jgi:transposase